jgi:hypothetical protein
LNYDIVEAHGDEGIEGLVATVVIGIKERDRVLIGGKETRI